MAKAKPKATTQILLKDALARVVAEVQVPHYAQQLIVRWIAKGQLPWGQKTWDGYCWRGKSPEEMIRHSGSDRFRSMSTGSIAVPLY